MKLLKTIWVKPCNTVPCVQRERCISTVRRMTYGSGVKVCRCSSVSVSFSKRLWCSKYTASSLKDEYAFPKANTLVSGVVFHTPPTERTLIPTEVLHTSTCCASAAGAGEKILAFLVAIPRFLTISTPTRSTNGSISPQKKTDPTKDDRLPPTERANKLYFLAQIFCIIIRCVFVYEPSHAQASVSRRCEHVAFSGRMPTMSF